MSNSFAVNIKRLRQEKNFTQTQLGEILQLSQRKISYLESGKIEPDMDTLVKIAEYFDITIDSLLKTDY